jgi:DNA-directed RNA polymerase specialized sigma24 family protein
MIQRGADRRRDDARLTTWMFLIAHDTIDHHRAVPRRRERPVGMWPDEGTYPGPTPSSTIHSVFEPRFRKACAH